MNVTILNCTWKEVIFIDCNLSDVDFSAVNLENVRFRNVDFRKVRFHTLFMLETSWKDMFLEHQLVGQGSIGGFRTGGATTAYMYAARGSQARSRHFCLQPITSMGQSLLLEHQSGALAQVRDLIKVEPLSLLDLPHSVLDKIMGELFPQFAVVVVDILLDKRLDTWQTTYEVLLSGRWRRITYDVMPLSVAGERIRLSCPFLLVSRRCYDLAVFRLYNRSFNFCGSAEGSLAFLHDHRREEHSFAHLTIRLNLSRADYFGATSLVGWRRLFNVLVHERVDLDRVTVVIERTFWEVSPWRMGIHAVMQTPGIDTISQSGIDVVRETRHFLQQVARLPASPDWSVQDGRIKFDLFIEGQWKDVEKRGFSELLKRHLCEEYMYHRPPLAMARHGSCSGTELENSCYWKKPTSANEGGC